MPRITKKEIKAVQLPIKVQLNTVVTLRWMHRDEQHTKESEVHTHRVGDTTPAPMA